MDSIVFIGGIPYSPLNIKVNEEYKKEYETKKEGFSSMQLSALRSQVKACHDLYQSRFLHAINHDRICDIEMGADGKPLIYRFYGLGSTPLEYNHNVYKALTESLDTFETLLKHYTRISYGSFVDAFSDFQLRQVMLAVDNSKKELMLRLYEIKLEKMRKERL